MLLTWFLFLWWANLRKVSRSLWCVSAKPQFPVSRLVSLVVSERLIGLRVSHSKKLPSSLEHRPQPVKIEERWRCQMLLRPPQHWSVMKSHHYWTVQGSLANLELAENQTNNPLRSFISTFSCKVFCASPPDPVTGTGFADPHCALTFDLWPLL